jgi:hypothetical protein
MRDLLPLIEQPRRKEQQPCQDINFGITPEVMAGGGVVSFGAVLVLWLAWKRHQLAPLFATIGGTQ